MILIDFNQIVINRMYMFQKNSNVDDTLFLNPILKKALARDIFDFVRKIHAEYGSIYGDVVMCADGGSPYWRAEIFEHYKASRKKQTADKVEMKKFVKEFIHEFYLEYKTGPIIVHKIDGIEADDIIAYLVLNNQYDKHMIVSRDKDFHQLHSPWCVSYDYIKKIIVCVNDGHRTLTEHIIRGDVGDGIPNILSDSDTFVVEGKRQVPMTKKKFQQCLKGDYSDEVKENYKRNLKLISLFHLPPNIIQKIEDGTFI